MALQGHPQSWQLGEVAKDWRKANVTQIFEKFKKDEPGNYRSISLPLITPSHKDNGADNTANHFQAPEGQEVHEEQTAWLHQV